MQEGNLPEAPIADNVEDYVPSSEAKKADALGSGFPCQAGMT